VGFVVLILLFVQASGCLAFMLPFEGLWAVTILGVSTSVGFRPRDPARTFRASTPGGGRENVLAPPPSVRDRSFSDSPRRRPENVLIHPDDVSP